MERPANRSYSLRGARATGAQEVAYEELWPQFGVGPTGEIDPAKLFPDLAIKILEIGSGMGEATAQIAMTFPEIGFLVVEVHKPGIGALMNTCNKQGSTNIKIVEEDVHLVLSNSLPDNSLDAIHLYFPDPWPKNRHHKRRIVNPAFLALIHPKLKAGGYIHIATDWIQYAQWIQATFAASDLFAGGVIERPDWRPISKFEGQGIRKGHIVTDMKYFKSYIFPLTS